MRRELVILGLAAALVTVSAAAYVADQATDAQASGSADVVMREPREGDRAGFEYTGGSFQGDEGPWTYERAWNRASVQLPDGTNRTLPTLSQWEPARVRTDGDETSRHRSTSLYHSTGLPGNVSAVSRRGTFEGESEDTSFVYRYDHTRLRTGDGCDGPLASRLAGQTPAQARAAIRACQWDGADRLSNVTVDISSQWRDNATYGDVWVAEVNATATTPDGETIHDNDTIVTSPERSFPVAVVEPGEPDDLATPADEGEPTTRRVLTSWTAGDEPLATHVDPLPEMPRVPIVDWTSSGPASNDLDPYPLSEAREAIERERDGRAFFGEADETRIAWATFVDQDETVRVTPSQSWSGGVECSAEDEAASATAPEAAGTRTWDLVWVSPDSGSLWADAQTRRIAQDNPTGERLPVADASAYHDEEETDEEGWAGFGVPPGERGPALDELWAHRDLLDAFDLEGTSTLQVHPTHVLGPDRPETRPLTGRIGTVDCVEHAGDDGDTTRELWIRFDEDGRATSVERSDSTWSWQAPDHLPPEGVPPGASGPTDPDGATERVDRLR